MSSTRIVLCCAILAPAIVATLAAQDVRDDPGPLEERATAITPENPVPRRTYSIAPAYPAEAQAIGASAVVSLRVTLDEAGRVGEIRRATIPIVMVPPDTPSNPTTLKWASDALVESATAALRQWQYVAPANGPIAFTVMFNFRPGSEPTMTQDTRAVPPRIPGPIGGGVVGGVVGGAVGAAVGGAPPGSRPVPVRVGGNVRPPTQVKRVNPAYPAEAQAAGVQGVVILEAIIGTDGRVTETRVLRSIPLLDEAALTAVEQWEYTPTLLNGVPVPVIMTVTVQFSQQ